MKHTPGPWVWKHHGHDDDWVRTDKGEAIVQVGHNQPEKEANGRLMAAAPEMLQILQVVADDAENARSYDFTEIAKKAAALLARLEGQEEKR